tara:strand:+ start:272 stop:1390 length:1119 start_codon:yes stop_codon:yes gene_type:complete
MGIVDSNNLAKSLRNTGFALISLLVSFFVYVYPIVLIGYLIFDLEPNPFHLAISSLGIACIIFVYLRTNLSSFYIRSFIFYGMGLGFIGFCVFNLGLIISTFQKDYKLEIGYLSLLSFLALSLYSFWQGRIIKLKILNFESAKINEPLKFLFFSDVHLGSNPRKHLENICTLIAKLDFDFLLIGGDLFDSSSFNINDLTPLQKIKSPVYFVTGNHEYYVKDHHSKLQALIKQNIVMLDNENIILNGINLIGISDNQSPERQFLLARSMIEKDLYNLLVVHKPSIWEKAKDFTDFMLSGHTHNGQIFPFGYLVRLQFKTVYGLFEQKNSKLFVSSGSGTWGPRMRLGTQNEILQLRINPIANRDLEILEKDFS